MKQVKKKAEVVFAVSKTTQKDLLEIFGFDDGRIKVIYHGISDLFFQVPRNPLTFPFPYILYIGNLKPHKNLTTLLEAFALIKSRYPDLRLLLVGVKQDKTFMRTLWDLKLKDRVVLKGYLTGEKLIQHIDGAEFFVFPSLYEGFGFPPLEAMARKKAVISSPGGSLKEVLGECALYFNPESFEELAERIIFFLEDEELRKSYQEKGFQHSLTFRWEKTVREYLETLKNLE